MEEQSSYLVEITSKAEQYYWSLLVHLYENHSIESANKKSDEIIALAMSLNVNPQRGSLEEDLAHFNKEFRSLIYRITKRKTVKIIYLIDELTNKVYVTDFFATLMNPDRKKKRS
ncbi:MAG: hypothetical protein GKR88_21110 [Flavobacteriaceae bacterium]|nr:MAG: hypothetical protein GKR88_04020 [Flavobacteriaceae bacterium]QMU66215.1 MAG: hypothetical protein GKR88_19320 [Flavobacteriaceae bacterium]QMU66540.1 MAG: hypothetical protein GKR88_21110 [Flavobacteriaceae bacterium]